MSSISILGGALHISCAEEGMTVQARLCPGEDFEDIANKLSQKKGVKGINFNGSSKCVHPGYVGPRDRHWACWSTGPESPWSCVWNQALPGKGSWRVAGGSQFPQSLHHQNDQETLPEAQRTQKLTPWLGINLATTWHLLHLLQIWPPDDATCNS